jgi:hypothetical protein
LFSPKGMFVIWRSAARRFYELARMLETNQLAACWKLSLT